MSNAIEERAAKLSAANAPKFCKDCARFKATYDQEKGKVGLHCYRPELLNMVTGQPTDPMQNRQNESKCGKDALYFVPIKNAQGEPSE